MIFFLFTLTELGTKEKNIEQNNSNSAHGKLIACQKRQKVKQLPNSMIRFIREIQDDLES